MKQPKFYVSFTYNLLKGNDAVFGCLIHKHYEALSTLQHHCGINRLEQFMAKLTGNYYGKV